MKKTSALGCRFTALLLAVILTALLLPAVALADGASYGRTNVDKVFLRTAANGEYYFCRLPKDWVVLVDGGTVSRGGKTWYKVRTNDPTKTAQNYTGYILDTCLTLLTPEEVIAWENNPWQVGGVHGYTATPAPGATARPTATPGSTVPTTNPGGVYNGYARVSVAVTNFRSSPSIDGGIIAPLLQNTVVQVITIPAGNTSDDWYYVSYNGQNGFIVATSLTLTSAPVVTSTPIPGTIVTPLPGTIVTPGPGGQLGYITLKLDKVNLRSTPDGTVLTPLSSEKLRKGTILPYYYVTPTKIASYYWAQVIYDGVQGYIRSDCFNYTDSLGSVVVTPPPASPIVTPPPTSSTPSSGFIRLTSGGVNFRKQASLSADRYGQLSKGTILPYYNTVNNNGTLWYYAYSTKFSGYGYIMGSLAQICGSDGGAVATPTPGVVTNTGYCATSISSVWIRESPNTGAGTLGKTGAKGTVLKMWGAAFTSSSNKYVWFPVYTNSGDRGYIRGDCVYQLAQWQVDQYLNSGTLATPTPGPIVPPVGNSDFIITTADKLYVRKAASAQSGSYGQVNSGEVFEYLSTSIVGNVTWYRIQYNAATVAWLHGNYVRILSNAEYLAWIGGQPTATPKPADTPVPDASLLSDVAFTTIEKVKIRGAASMNGKELTVVATAGTKLTYLGTYRTAAETGTNYNWFNIKYAGVSGWMRGDCVRVLTADELAMYNLTGNPDSPPEATYATLRLGSTGDEVKNLQDKLVEKGYLKAGTYTAYSYDSATVLAVSAFQRAESLSDDGVAGEQTQHKLFNTVPVGTYTGSTVTPNLYPVEMIDWYTGGIQSIFGVGSNAIVTDVYTGITMRMQRLYGDAHADVEPLTTADTAAFCRMFGVSTAQEVSDRESALQSWRRRPLWVTIGNRTFAASMYAVPHNFPGDRIPDNNFNGQVCIHFVNSKTHGTDRVDTDSAANGYFGHQSAIRYAYSHSISGTK